MAGKRLHKCPECGSKNYTCNNAPWSYPLKFHCKSCDIYFQIPSDEEIIKMREKREQAKAEKGK